MKKLIFIAILVIAGYSASYSQNKPVIKYYSTEIMDEINATETQREAVKDLVAKYDVLFKELKVNKSTSKEEYETERKRLIGERAKEYWKILTPAQTKYLKDKAKSN